MTHWWLIRQKLRVDLEREVDLVEEVARLIGYNDIPISLPSVDLSYPEQDQERIRRNAACSVMTKFGFTEAINYSFYSSSYDAKMLLEEADKRCSHVKILNPLTEDQDVMTDAAAGVVRKYQTKHQLPADIL